MAMVGEVFDFSLNDSTLMGMLNKINSFTDVGGGGILGIVILLLVGGTLVLMMKSYGFERALSVAMIITSIIGIFLRVLGWITDPILYVCIALLVIGIIFLIIEAERYET